jgi:hypothetical protein
VCYQFGVFKQSVLRFSQARLFELAFNNRRYTFICRSLNPQEVCMAVQSIRTPVQIGHIGSNHLLVSAGKMSLGEMNRVGELDDLA